MSSLEHENKHMSYNNSHSIVRNMVHTFGKKAENVDNDGSGVIHYDFACVGRIFCANLKMLRNSHEQAGLLLYNTCKSTFQTTASLQTINLPNSPKLRLALNECKCVFQFARRDKVLRDQVCSSMRACVQFNWNGACQQECTSNIHSCLIKRKFLWRNNTFGGSKFINVCNASSSDECSPKSLCKPNVSRTVSGCASLFEALYSSIYLPAWKSVHVPV
ncbi:hypothetical protein HELRODRAFT_162261 [Helobdella robusta]|uniref:Uncharacterized protein n=1 Tax=Helobdella robusta TaxID=6412 RepID=T1ESF6_HELRO|nr:hypothetical protein HELRODRAFT_162261 [Helobdella robusta]ESN98801.1 hypothetical protein HELRODRAFT_162261 [Helobdella robusta]